MLYNCFGMNLNINILSENMKIFTIITSLKT